MEPKQKLTIVDWAVVNWRTLYAASVMLTNIAVIWGLDPDIKEKMDATLASMNGVLAAIIGGTLIQNVTNANKTIANAHALTATVQAAGRQAEATVVAAVSAPSDALTAMANDQGPMAATLLAAAQRTANAGLGLPK